MISGIKFEGNYLISGLDGLSIVIQNGPVNFVIIFELFFEKINSESLHVGDFSWSNDSQATCILNDRVFGSQEFDDALNIDWKSI